MNRKNMRNNEAVELGALLAKTIGSVVEAQEKLDAYTEKRRRAYESAPEGALAVPPLWYVFNNVSVEMELSAQIAKSGNDNTDNREEDHLICKTLNPASVGLYGYQASSGLKVKVSLAPQGFLNVRQS